MQGAPAHATKIGRTGAWRLIVSVILLFAFGLQSYITQTHFHRPPVAAERLALVAHGPSPADNEASGCPFCQAIAAAGAFFASATAALGAPPLRTLATARPPIPVGLASAAAGFGWRSRAPPQS